MRAILVRGFGGPDVLRLEDVPDPKPGPSEVVVRIRAAGVNPVDTYIRSGTYARKPPLPYIPGSDGAGEIESVGAEVTNVAAGDRVYIAGYGNKPSGAGTYAERAVCATSQIYPLPSRVSFTQGAALGVPYGTAYRALFQPGAARPRGGRRQPRARRDRRAAGDEPRRRHPRHNALQRDRCRRRVDSRGARGRARERHSDARHRPRVPVGRSRPRPRSGHGERRAGQDRSSRIIA